MPHLLKVRLEWEALTVHFNAMPEDILTVSESKLGNIKYGYGFTGHQGKKDCWIEILGDPSFVLEKSAEIDWRLLKVMKMGSEQDMCSRNILFEGEQPEKRVLLVIKDLLGRIAQLEKGLRLGISVAKKTRKWFGDDEIKMARIKMEYIYSKKIP